jgi:hypothetical protein
VAGRLNAGECLRWCDGWRAGRHDGPGCLDGGGVARVVEPVRRWALVGSGSDGWALRPVTGQPVIWAPYQSNRGWPVPQAISLRCMTQDNAARMPWLMWPVERGGATPFGVG